MTADRRPLLAGRHALVTGGGRGVGTAVAHRLAEDGARLNLVGRRLGSQQAFAVTLPAVAEARAGACDVADAGSVARALEQAAEDQGPVQVFVNNADQAASAPFARTSDTLWQQMLAVNLSGSVYCTRAVLRAMLTVGWGRIVNVARAAGQRGCACVAAYAAATRGVVALTRSLALEVATRGITVNTVCPGYTETELLERSVGNVVAKTGRSADDARAELTRHNPQGRIVRPEELADALAWPCGPGAAAINGHSISVSGGEVT